VIHHLYLKRSLTYSGQACIKSPENRGDLALAGQRQRPVQRMMVHSLLLIGAHHGAGGKELWKFIWMWTCSNAAVRGASSSSGSGSKNRRRTKAT
jgi:hypothetical protein